MKTAAIILTRRCEHNLLQLLHHTTISSYNKKLNVFAKTLQINKSISKIQNSFWSLKMKEWYAWCWERQEGHNYKWQSERKCISEKQSIILQCVLSQTKSLIWFLASWLLVISTGRFIRTFIIRGWIKETCLGVGVISYYNV